MIEPGDVYPILLAGGIGTRLWPVSRELYPKQLVNFMGKDSLVQNTVKRLMPAIDIQRIRIVCGKEHFHEIARHLEDIGVDSEGKIVCEPCGRNTAPAILLGVCHLLREEKDAVLCIFPADHVIRDVTGFHEKLRSAVRLAEEGYIVTFGIKPHYPETGYGYIEGDQEISEGALSIKRFVEKPDRKTAEAYLEAGNFFWNSGMFAFKMSVILEEFKILAPELLKTMGAVLENEKALTKDAYESLPDISFDYAIMEKTEKGAVLPSDFGWSDIGSWKSLYDFFSKDENRNVIDGDVISNDTTGCFIMGRKRLIATNHLQNMVIVETPDSVFVSDLENSRDVKSIVAKLKEKGREEHHRHATQYHSWGSSTMIEKKEFYSVIRINLYPQAFYAEKIDPSISRHLFVIRGAGILRTAGEVIRLKKGDAAIVQGKTSVRIENTENDKLWMIQIEYRG
ncbi:mannose-1-phosphate guanylyltransferase/mannose-6-phosphate isomerase [Thermodesulfobacteriota bacterium]